MNVEAVCGGQVRRVQVVLDFFYAVHDVDKSLAFHLIFLGFHGFLHISEGVS